ncbi:hypothetical protein F5B21DRAFT_464831 [Xylaria acuta]|nr:hypothetical protein F5B21DRAFT_464831 [Xylaria acuta]
MAELGKLFGCRRLFIGTYAALTAFSAHPAFLRRRLWVFIPHRRRWCHCGHVLGFAMRKDIGHILCSSLPKPGSCPRHR